MMPFFSRKKTHVIIHNKMNYKGVIKEKEVRLNLFEWSISE